MRPALRAVVLSKPRATAVALNGLLTTAYLGPNRVWEVDASQGTNLATAQVDRSPTASSVAVQGTTPTFSLTGGPNNGPCIVFTGVGDLVYTPGYVNDGPLMCMFRATAANVGGGYRVLAATNSTNVMNVNTDFLGTFGNSAPIPSSVSATNGSDHLFILDARTNYGAGQMIDNGTDVGVYASSGNYGETLLGGSVGAGQLATANIRFALQGCTPWDTALLDNAAIKLYHIMTAIPLWAAGLQSLLPGAHPFATSPPRGDLVANRVLIGGDSYAVAVSTSYSQLFADNHPSLSVVQRAVAGTYIASWSEVKFDQTVAARPKALALQLGTNLYPTSLGNMTNSTVAANALIQLWNYLQDALPSMDLFFPTILPVDETRANTSSGTSQYTGFNTWRAAVNTIIRGQHNTTRNGGRRLCYDFAADATIGINSAATGALWNADGIHPEYTTQQTYMYPIFNAAMVAAGYN